MAVISAEVTKVSEIIKGTEVTKDTKTGKDLQQMQDSSNTFNTLNHDMVNGNKTQKEQLTVTVEQEANNLGTPESTSLSPTLSPKSPNVEPRGRHGRRNSRQGQSNSTPVTPNHSVDFNKRLHRLAKMLDTINTQQVNGETEIAPLDSALREWAEFRAFEFNQSRTQPVLNIQNGGNADTKSLREAIRIRRQSKEVAISNAGLTPTSFATMTSAIFMGSSTQCITSTATQPSSLSHVTNGTAEDSKQSKALSSVFK